MLLWWTRWTQGAMEQDHGWLAQLQVRVQSLLLLAVALLRILSPIYITLRPREAIFLLDDQLLTFYIPAPPPCLRFSSLACSTEALHSLTSPTLTDSLQPLISTPHYQHLS